MPTPISMRIRKIFLHVTLLLTPTYLDKHERINQSLAD